MGRRTIELTGRMDDAFRMAREIHDDAPIKGSDRPYLTHLLDVCSIALRHGADEDQAIAALLHDTVEDGGGTPVADEIRRQFGDRVADIVLVCSDSVAEDPDDKAPWWERKVAYLDQLAAAAPDAALVSGADKLANARSIVADLAEPAEQVEISDSVFDKFTAGRVGTLWYYRRIAELLPPRLPPTGDADRLGRMLRAAVDQMLELVGHEQVAVDWELAVAEEQRVRASR